MSSSKKTIDVVTLGEPLMILRPPPYSTMENARSLELLVGGSETNVAVGATRLGLKSAMIGKVVANSFGRTFVNTIRGLGVDTSGILWSTAGKTAFMFVELGLAPRPNRTFYDREGSVTRSLRPSEVDWRLVRQARVFHTTGITLSLGKACAQTVERGIREAKKAGTLVSFDVNYRSQMWTVDRARYALENILESVDILTISREDASKLFGLTGSPERLVKALKKRFGNRIVIVTLGELGAIGYERKICRVNGYQVSMVNPYGAGDSFVAGFLYGFLNGGLKNGITYGCAVAALKLTIANENLPLVNKEDVESLVQQGIRSLEKNSSLVSSDVAR